jgi:hypothetical protein
MSRPDLTSIPQLIQGFRRSYELKNFGKRAEHCYLPHDLYVLTTAWIQDQFISGGIPAELLDAPALAYTMHGMILHARDGYDIVVTSEELL